MVCRVVSLVRILTLRQRTTLTLTDSVKSEFGINITVMRAVHLKNNLPDKPRLLLISLEDLATRRGILQNATNLRSSPTWKNVYYIP